MTVHRRTFLGALATAVAPAAKRPPNIVYIMLDDLGYGDAGCYGQKMIQTPNIDRLATEGTRFTDCYAGCTVCAPSRSVLMTGLHTGHTAVRTNAGTVPLTASDVTVAQILKKAGYATGGFGKWGLGDAGSAGVPTKHGFDEFFGYLHQIHAHFYYPEFLRDGERRYPLPGNANGQKKQYSADVIHDRALRFLRANRNKPFFLYATYTLPHADYDPPNDDPYSDRDWPDQDKHYAAMVTRGDKMVGEILRTLSELKLDDNTVVFFTSDNGGTGPGVKFFTSNGPLQAQKGTLYEGGIRVPMIVRWKGRVAAGAVSDFPWCFCDIMPTFSEIAGVKPPSRIDGMSVLPAILGKKQEHNSFYWEFHQFDRKINDLKKGSMMQAARMGYWKAVRPALTVPIELYDLKTDIGEARNVAAQNPEIVEKMERYMKASHTEPRPHNTGDFEYKQ